MHNQIEHNNHNYTQKQVIIHLTKMAVYIFPLKRIIFLLKLFVN